MAVRLQGVDDAQLGLGEHAGENVRPAHCFAERGFFQTQQFLTVHGPPVSVETDLLGDGRRGDGVVAGDDLHLDARLLELAEDFADVGFRGIDEGDQAEVFDQEFLLALRIGVRWVLHIAHAEHAHALPGESLHLGHGRLFLPVGQHGLPQDPFRGALAGDDAMARAVGEDVGHHRRLATDRIFMHHPPVGPLIVRGGAGIGRVQPLLHGVEGHGLAGPHGHFHQCKGFRR